MVIFNLNYILFCGRLIKHTEQLLEEKEDKLCVKVLKTLQEMMAIDLDYGDKVYPLKYSIYLQANSSIAVYIHIYF